VLGAILFALADPVFNYARRPEKNVVILIDRSGSMQTMEPDGRTRLAHAKEAATRFANDLLDRSWFSVTDTERPRAMVISFADRAAVECAFSDDVRQVRRMIDRIEATDGPSRIGEALQLSVAYSTNLVDLETAATPAAAAVADANLELFSDGRIQDADEQYVTRGQMRYYPTGHATDNAGVVVFDVRRNYDRPGFLSVFAQVENFGPAPIRSDVSLLLDGRLLSVQEVALGAAGAATTQPGDLSAAVGADGAIASSQNVIFELEHEAGGVVEVKLHGEDALSIDDVAAAPIDPPRDVAVLGVTKRRGVRDLLSRGLAGAGVDRLEWMTPEKYEGAAGDEVAVEGRAVYDLIVFDNHSTNRLPPGNYVFFGGAPEVEGIRLGEEVTDQTVITWSETHPLLRYVSFANIYIAKWRRLALPSHAVKLVLGEDSTPMAFVTDPGHRYLIASFDLFDSDFPLRLPFPIFLQNCVRYLAAGGLVETGRMVSPGDTLTIPVPAGATDVRITRPDGTTDTLPAENRSFVTYARTQDAGVYRARFDDPVGTVEVYAANTLDRTESMIAANDAFTVGTEQITAIEGEIRTTESLWPYLAGLALVVLLFEWWVYNRRVML